MLSLLVYVSLMTLFSNASVIPDKNIFIATDVTCSNGAGCYELCVSELLTGIPSKTRFSPFNFANRTDCNCPNMVMNFKSNNSIEGTLIFFLIFNLFAGIFDNGGNWQLKNIEKSSFNFSNGENCTASFAFSSQGSSVGKKTTYLAKP